MHLLTLFTIKFLLKHNWDGEKAALGFELDRIRTLISMATDSSQGGTAVVVHLYLSYSNYTSLFVAHTVFGHPIITWLFTQPSAFYVLCQSTNLQKIEPKSLSLLSVIRVRYICLYLQTYFPPKMKKKNVILTKKVIIH